MLYPKTKWSVDLHLVAKTDRTNKYATTEELAGRLDVCNVENVERAGLSSFDLEALSHGLAIEIVAFVSR